MGPRHDEGDILGRETGRGLAAQAVGHHNGIEIPIRRGVNMGLQLGSQGWGMLVQTILKQFHIYDMGRLSGAQVNGSSQNFASQAFESHGLVIHLYSSIS